MSSPHRKVEVEHVVHVVPPRVLGSDPKHTIIDSLCVIADKQRSANKFAIQAIELDAFFEDMLKNGNKSRKGL